MHKEMCTCTCFFLRPSYVMALSFRASVRGHFSFADFFGAIFGCSALKLGLLLCIKELQFQFAFQWLIHFCWSYAPWTWKNFSVFRTFFAIFANIRLKFGLLFCSNELQFQFTFQCDWFIFAGVMPPELRRILRIFQFSGLFFAIFAAVAFYCFLVKSSSSSSCFGVIDSFLQELDPLNLEEF
jgi:hypothetical protein